MGFPPPRRPKVVKKRWAERRPKRRHPLAGPPVSRSGRPVDSDPPTEQDSPDVPNDNEGGTP